MCARAVKLRKYIDEWLQQEIDLNAISRNANNDDNAEIDTNDLRRLQLSATEWHHLKLIGQMLEKFKEATEHLSQNQKPQIPYIWLMYNRLFDFLDEITEKLGEDVEDQEDDDWPSVVRAAADRGRAKLSKYYSKTEAARGFLFNCATILDPTQKLTVYEVRVFYYSYLSR